MKKIKLLSACIFLFGFIHAQDLLIMRNGDDLKVKVLEITPTEIKYKKFESPEGVLYVIRKSDAFMVKYENGTKDVFNRYESENRPMTNFDKKDPYKKESPLKDYNFYNHKARRGIVTGAVLTGVGVPTLLLGTGISLMSAGNVFGNNNSNGGDMGFAGGGIVAGVLLTAGGLAMSILGPINLARGIHYRKLARQKKPELSLLPICSPSMTSFSSNVNFKAGAGMRLVF
jgi:hypothetical protein